jgi:polyhydroxyalkanoate synthesis regulator phasin
LIYTGENDILLLCIVNIKGENKMADSLSEDLRKLILAGIGAAALTVEKAKTIIDECVKKGELTFEQGKVINEELKHDIKKTVEEKAKAGEKKVIDLINNLDTLTSDEVKILKAKIAQIEKGKTKSENAKQ